ncbi:MAG: cation transporter [Verrucomicrobiota bacterium]|nr:cation transporter [Verrucomicrobiota bacterium]
MSCATCEIGVRSALAGVKGVKSANVSVATNSATVEFDPAQAEVEQLVTAINSTGYRAPPVKK